MMGSDRIRRSRKKYTAIYAALGVVVAVIASIVTYHRGMPGLEWSLLLLPGLGWWYDMDRMPEYVETSKAIKKCAGWR